MHFPFFLLVSLITAMMVSTNLRVSMSCISPPTLRSNGITGAVMFSWLAWSITSPSRRGPEHTKATQSPSLGMPSICGVRARPAEGVGLYPSGRKARTLRLNNLTVIPFGYEKWPSAPHGGMCISSPCSRDARPSASSTYGQAGLCIPFFSSNFLIPWLTVIIGNLKSPRSPIVIGPETPMTLLSDATMLPGLKWSLLLPIEVAQPVSPSTRTCVIDFGNPSGTSHPASNSWCS